MDTDAIELLGDNSCLHDSPKLEDLSEFANLKVEAALAILKGKTTVDEETLKELLLELMLAEKRCRLACDGESNSKICNFILSTLYDYGDFKNLNYYLILLSKKRGQLKHTIVEMINLAKGWMHTIQDIDAKLSLINTLNDITSGKMFLEKQRAEIVFTLAKIKESHGKIAEASTILHDIEVETFGGISKMEKVEYILEQMRIHLLNGDYIRFYITSRKISEALLESDGYAQMKLRYFEYMIKYHLQENDYFGIAKACYKRLDTLFKIGDASWPQELECLVLFLLISPITQECQAFMESFSTAENKKLKEISFLGDFFSEFLSDNLIPWPLAPELESLLGLHTVFQDTPLPGGSERFSILRDRTIQHNIIIISKYYTSIRLSRLAELTNSSIDKLEEDISTMVDMGTIYAKIDRPAGIVKFGKKREPEVVLNKWAKDIASLMDLVGQCSRLVQKEKMIHEARAKQVELDSYFHS